MKYGPEFPDRFACLQDSHAFCQRFFPWYNNDHPHSGIGMLTPAMVHFGQASAIGEKRQTILDAVYAAHPDRLVRRPPIPPPLSTEVWINRSTNRNAQTKMLTKLKSIAECLKVVDTHRPSPVAGGDEASMGCSVKEYITAPAPREGNIRLLPEQRDAGGLGHLSDATIIWEGYCGAMPGRAE